MIITYNKVVYIWVPARSLEDEQGHHLKRRDRRMGVVRIVKSIKQVHPSCVVMVKIGSFYSVYGKDAYIFSYIFNYKIIEKENVPICSFPMLSISKIENILEKKKINYIAVDKRTNYEVEQKVINKQENNYDKIFEKAQKNIKILRVSESLCKL